MLHTNYLNPSCALITCGSVALATILRAAVDLAFHEQIPYTTFFPAVMLSALCCGLRWGLASIVLSATAASLWLTPFGRPLIMEATDLAGMGLFLVVCFLIVWLASRVRSHRQFAEAAAEDRRQLLIREQAARKDAERANRAKDDFLAEASHELRTPLNSILGWVQLLRHNALTDDEAQLALESVERSVKVQAQLISDLMELSRIRMGKMRIESKPVDLSKIVASSVQTVLPAAKAKGISLQGPAEEATGMIVGDSDRLQQVVWNLLSNAIKFTPSGGTVQVAVSETARDVVLEVRDTGEGIEGSLLPTIFDRFQQGDAGSAHGGLGLGLSIVKEIVELHGGSIGAASDGKGLGSTFTVDIPRARLVDQELEPDWGDSGADASKSNGGGDPTLKGLHVLIVDDDASEREWLGRTLRDAGARTVCAASGAEALSIIAGATPDLVISDLGMPEMDGFELVRRLRESAATGRLVPALAVTGLDGTEWRHRARSVGFNDQLCKPVEREELIRAVSQLTPVRRRPR